MAAQLSGIEVRAAVEIDPYACSTYRNNLVDAATGFPKLIEGDINLISWADVLEAAHWGTPVMNCWSDILIV